MKTFAPMEGRALSRPSVVAAAVSAALSDGHHRNLRHILGRHLGFVGD